MKYSVITHYKPKVDMEIQVDNFIVRVELDNRCKMFIRILHTKYYTIVTIE